MINIPLETEKQGIHVDGLIEELVKATGDSEQNAMAKLVAWEKKGLVLISQERDADGELRFYVWKRDPAVVAKEKRSAWRNSLNALGGIEETIFGDVPQEKIYKALFGRAYKAVMREIKEDIGIVRETINDVVAVVEPIVAPVVAKVAGVVEAVTKIVAVFKNWIGLSEMPVPALAVIQIENRRSDNKSQARSGIP